MKRRMRPIDGTFHIPMLDRVGVDVIGMTMPVPLVSNHMLPTPSRLDAAFTLAHPAGGNAFATREHSREMGFDQAPAHRKIVVIRRQAPQAMQVVRQYHHGLDHKRMRLLRHAQFINVLSEPVIAMTFRQVHREKISCAGYAGTCVVSHGAMIAGIASQPTVLTSLL